MAALALLSFSPALAQSPNLHQITFPLPGGQDAYATYSPRGDKVAFCRWLPGGQMVPAVFVVDLLTGVEDTLVGIPEGLNPGGTVQWSPDGAHILYNHDSHNGLGLQVWVADLPAAALPKVVATCMNENDSGRYVLDSNGMVYFFGNITPRCDTTPLEILPVGPMFGGGAPISAVMSIDVQAGLVAVLQNGDVWKMCNLSGSWPIQGEYKGNMFAAAGITAVAQEPRAAINIMASARPNPFNPDTQIPYTLASSGRVRILVFDVNGRLVRNLEDTTRQAGQYVARWDGQNDRGEAAASGTYFARITYPDGTTAEQKMTVLR